MSVKRTLAGTFATKAAGLVLVTLVGIVISRALGREGRGAVDALVTWAAVLLLAYPSMEEPQLFLLGRKVHSPATLFTNAVVASLGFGLAVAGVFELLVHFVPELFLFENRRTGAQGMLDLELLRILVLVSPFEIASRLVGGLLQGLRGMRAFNAVHLVRNTLLFALVAALVLGAPLGVRGAVLAYAGSMAAAGLAAVIFAARHPEVRAGPFRPNAGALVTLVKGGLRIHGGVIAAILILMSDKLILTRFHGREANGLYANAVALTGQLRQVVLQPMKEVLGSRLPSLADAAEERLQVIAQVSRHTLLLTALPAVALAALGYPLILLLYGPEFGGSYLPLLILIPGSLCWAAAVITSYWFIGTNRLLTLTGINVAVAATNLALNFLLIPRAGMVAAASTSSICYALHLTVFLAYLRRSEGTHPGLFLRPRPADWRVYADLTRKLLERLRRSRARPAAEGAEPRG